MKIIDVNLLIYAVNQDAPAHGKAKKWLESALTGTETIALPWIVLLAFLRLTTRPGLFQKPILAALAIEHNAELCSTDNDFSRFPRLRWSNPLAG